jgi:hemerythrin-like domain-containing protein
LNSETNPERRRLLIAGVGAALGALPLAGEAAPPRGRPAAVKKWDPDEGVTAPEDLMKEHGVLNRCLLIYEEGVHRLRQREEIAPEVFQHTAALVRRFVEQYHEKNEENYIFPHFKRAGKLTDLVDTLLRQHKAGRAVTAQILHLSTPPLFSDPQNQQRLVAAVESFIRMYRPHEAREDTVLFPALRTILPLTSWLLSAAGWRRPSTRCSGMRGLSAASLRWPRSRSSSASTTCGSSHRPPQVERNGHHANQPSRSASGLPL